MGHDPEKHVLDPIGDGYRFSDKVMPKEAAQRKSPDAGLGG
jgi:hypothetical protein